MKHYDRVWAEIDLNAVLFNIESIKKNVKMIIDWNNSPFENTMCSNLLHLIDNPENTYILTRNKKEIMPLVKAYIRERKR